MEEIVLRFLRLNYRFTLRTFTLNSVVDLSTKDDIKISEVLVILIDTFSLDKIIIFEIFEKWVEEETTRINNLIVDYQYTHFNLTGKSVVECPIDLGLDLE